MSKDDERAYVTLDDGIEQILRDASRSSLHLVRFALVADVMDAGGDRHTVVLSSQSAEPYELVGLLDQAQGCIRHGCAIAPE